MLIAAAYTPFGVDGSLAVGQVAVQAEWLASLGVDGVFIAGTTGESLSLSTAERMTLAEAWSDAAPIHGLSLFVHVGCSSLVESCALASHAGRLQVAAISAMAPSYFKPATCADLATFLAEVAAAAPVTPFYYYDIPTWTGVSFRSSDLLEKHAASIPTLAGIKFSSSDLPDFERCVAAGDGRFKMFWGCDEALLAGLTLGAHGAIGSSYNFAAAEARRVQDAFHRGDLAAARTAQLKIVRIVDAIARHGYLRASKTLMGMLGIDCGAVRLPLAPLSHDEQEDLLRACEAVGLECGAAGKKRLAIHPTAKQVPIPNAG